MLQIHAEVETLKDKEIEKELKKHDQRSRR